MPDTMRSVLIQGARRYQDGLIADDEFIRGVVLAIAEAPTDETWKEDLQWLADRLTSTN